MLKGFQPSTAVNSVFSRYYALINADISTIKGVFTEVELELMTSPVAIRALSVTDFMKHLESRGVDTHLDLSHVESRIRQLTMCQFFTLLEYLEHYRTV